MEDLKKWTTKTISDSKLHNIPGRCWLLWSIKQPSPQWLGILFDNRYLFLIKSIFDLRIWIPNMHTTNFLKLDLLGNCGKFTLLAFAWNQLLTKNIALPLSSGDKIVCHQAYIKLVICKGFDFQRRSEGGRLLPWLYIDQFQY